MLHIVVNLLLAGVALFIPAKFIPSLAVAGFIAIFLFEFIRINTGAKKYVDETVGPLFKKKESFQASGLFWVAVAALIIALFAAPNEIAYGFAVLALADPAAAIGGRLIPSRRLYRRKTFSGLMSAFAVAALVSLVFAYMYVPARIALGWALILGILIALLEMYSHPFDDNFTILLFATTVMHFTLGII